MACAALGSFSANRAGLGVPPAKAELQEDKQMHIVNSHNKVTNVCHGAVGSCTCYRAVGQSRHLGLSRVLEMMKNVNGAGAFLFDEGTHPFSPSHMK